MSTKTQASKVAVGRWNLRAVCERFHTSFKRITNPDAEYACPWCAGDVR